MTIRFVDLVAQGEELAEELDAAFRSVAGRGAFTLGPEVREFEAEFARFCGCERAVGVSSGTDALKLAYLAVGVGRDDEVIVPANTFIATAEAVSHVGATPVFVDCLADGTMDPDSLGDAASARTKAIVPVHLYGQPARMEPILAFGEDRGIPVIEDACQAHGARYRDRMCGSMGAAAAFSFYPGKNLGALGDGGAVTTNDPVVADRVALLRNHGQSDKYTHASIGYCDRLHNLQAAFLSVKLTRLVAWNEARRRVAAAYDRLLCGVAGVTPVETRGDVVHAHHLYVVELEDRDAVKARLEADGIEVGIHYPVPLHLTKAYAHLGYVAGDMPCAERLSRRILSLPMHPHLSPADTERVVERLAHAAQG